MQASGEQSSTRNGEDMDLSDDNEEELFEDPLEEIPIKHQVGIFYCCNQSLKWLLDHPSTEPYFFVYD